MSEMTDYRAAEVLAAHNEWRRYNGETGVPDAPEMGDPAEIGRAIDHVVSRFRAQPPAEARPVGGKLLSEGGAGCMDCDGYQDEGVFCPTCGTDHSEPPPSAPVCQAFGGTGEMEVPMKINDVETDTTLIGCDACNGTGQQPPSAPVGVEGLAGEWSAHAATPGIPTPVACAFDTCAQMLRATLAQQPAAVDGAKEAVRRVADHIGTAVEYIEKQYPDAPMLDRGPILRNMRRWHERLTAALAAQQGGRHE